MKIEIDDLSRPAIHALLNEHLQSMYELRAISREAQVGASEEGQLHARFERRELGRFVRAVFCCALVEEASAA